MTSQNTLTVFKFDYAIKMVVTIILTGFSMWFLAGLWHNLVLPKLDVNAHAHHHGIFILLLAYWLLALLMFAILLQLKRVSLTPTEGLIFGITIGLLWVLPHGLAMAAAHDTSIAYEFKNAAWHLVEQGLGGVVMALLMTKFNQQSERHRS